VHGGRKGVMSQIRPVIHIYDREIEPHIVCSPDSLIVKFHTNCDIVRLFEFLRHRLTEIEWQIFHTLWTDDSAERTFEVEEGYVVIS
jgi:hypothetical protein